MDSAPFPLRIPICDPSAFQKPSHSEGDSSCKTSGAAKSIVPVILNAQPSINLYAVLKSASHKRFLEKDKNGGVPRLVGWWVGVLGKPGS